MNHWLQPGFTQEIKRSYICPLPPQDRVSLCCLHSLRIAIITALRHSFHFSSAKRTTDRTNCSSMTLDICTTSGCPPPSLQSSVDYSTQTGVTSLSLPFPADLNAEALLSCTTNTTCLKNIRSIKMYFYKYEFRCCQQNTSF